jgi:hypothetical protein
MKFSTLLSQTGANTTGIEVPPEVVEALGGGKKPKVVVTLNGYQYRSSIASMGGIFLISVSADIRAKANVKGGDPIEVDLALDNAPREVTIPSDFAEALAGSPGAKSNFDALSFSNKSRHVLSIEGAKTEATRQKRIAKAIEELKR